MTTTNQSVGISLLKEISVSRRPCSGEGSKRIANWNFVAQNRTQQLHNRTRKCALKLNKYFDVWTDSISLRNRVRFRLCKHPQRLLGVQTRKSAQSILSKWSEIVFLVMSSNTTPSVDIRTICICFWTWKSTYQIEYLRWIFQKCLAVVVTIVHTIYSDNLSSNSAVIYCAIWWKKPKIGVPTQWPISKSFIK